MTTYAQLHPKYIFGLNGTCNGVNLWFLDNNTILYPAGNSVVMLSLDQKAQNFIHGVEKGNGVTALTVSQNRAYCAVAQMGEGKPFIVVFDLKLNKKRKTLQFNDTSADRYISLAFTQDCLNLASLTGGPEYNLVFWKWDRSRMLCFARTTAGGGPVYELTTSPAENNAMCAIGKNCFRFYRFNDNHLKPYGFQRGDSYHFICHAWIGKGDRVIAGTSDGKLMLFERGEYRHDIPIVNVTNEITGALAEKSKLHDDVDGAPSVVSINPTDKEMGRPVSMYTGKEITTVAGYSKGFVAGYGVGNVIVFEEQGAYDSPEERYRQVCVVRIPPLTSECEDRIVRSLAVSPNDEVLIATTYNCQIFTFPLSAAEVKEPHEMFFEYANCSYHFGPVLSMDVAIRKSLVVTCGTDKFIRIWNFLSMSQEASKELAEEIFCVSIHPIGLYVLAGCIDKIRMFSVLMHDIREFKDWQVRACREIRFSNGGHLFAAGNGNILCVYSTTTLENTANMKGHSNRIKRITWAQNDMTLTTAGADGAIYEWDITTGKRVADVVERGSRLVSVVIAPDNKTHYAINANQYLKEIQLQDGMILKEFDLGIVPSCLALSLSGKYLLSGFENGVLRSFRKPLTNVGDWFDFHMHFGSVTQLVCTFDELYCVTCSNDNSIIIWKMSDSEGRMARLEKDLSYSTDVLVTKQDLDERETQVTTLKQRFGELRLEMDYQLKRKDMLYQEEIRDLSKTYKSQILQLNEQLGQMYKAKEQSEGDHSAHMKEVKKKHEDALENIETHFNTKLVGEFEKYNALQNLLDDTIKEYEARLLKLDEEARHAITEMADTYDQKLVEKDTAIDGLKDTGEKQAVENEEMINQIEMDADYEILEVTTTYEKKLRRERETNSKLKGEAGIMRKKFQTMQHDVEDQKNEVHRLVGETSKLKTIIQTLEKHIATLQKDMVDRDENVADKEKMVRELAKDNVELKKFNYVLDYKVTELQKVLEPKERDITYLRQQNSDMENELKQTISVRNGYELQLNELTRKLQILNSEYQNERYLRFKLIILLKRIRAHMSRATGLIQDDKELKICVLDMYAKYGYSMEVSKANNAEQEAICELVRQKNHLEASLSSIKKKLAKDIDFARKDRNQVMEENMKLVQEINIIRQEMARVRSKLLTYENMLGVAQMISTSDPAEFRMHLKYALEDRNELEENYLEQLLSKENVIRFQDSELEQLSTKLMKIEDYLTEAQPDQQSSKAVDYMYSVLYPTGRRNLGAASSVSSSKQKPDDKKPKLGLKVKTVKRA